MSFNFSKWTGLGNDFVLIEPGEFFDLTSGEALENKVIEICDRRFGIGADGVVIVTPLPQRNGISKGIDFEMRIFNADGSEAAMCGNATRCVAKFIQSRGLSQENTFFLHTKSGLVKPTILSDGNVCVNMGLPRSFLGTIKLTADTFDFTGETVSMGNPHTVIFVDDIKKIELEKWGAILEVNRIFPDRSNIEFAQVINRNTICMRVWERGCGVTMACGTGSCATLVAAQRTGRVGVEADIILDGGTLHIKHEEGGSIFMTGPAKECFKGTYE